MLGDSLDAVAPEHCEWTISVGSTDKLMIVGDDNLMDITRPFAVVGGTGRWKAATGELRATFSILESGQDIFLYEIFLDGDIMMS